MTCNARTLARICIGLTLALAMVVVWPGNGRTVSAQQDEQVFYFRVRDTATGASVTDLAPDEFRVSQDGVLSEIVSAELVATRLQLAIVLDDSNFMRGYHNNMVNGMPGFLEALPEGSDVSLIAMADRPTILQDFTTDMALVKEKFGDYFPRPGTGAAFLDTVHRVADNMQQEDGKEGVPEGGTWWPVIAVIGSDGNDVSRGNQMKMVNDLVTKLREIGATLHYLMLENTGQGTQHQMVDLFTTNTAGWHDRVSGPSQLAEDTLAVMAAVIAQQHAARANQYRVVFRPPTESTAGFSVSVNRPGVALKVSVDGRP